MMPLKVEASEVSRGGVLVELPEDFFDAFVGGAADFFDEILGTLVGDVSRVAVHSGLAVEFVAEVFGCGCDHFSRQPRGRGKRGRRGRGRGGLR